MSRRTPLAALLLALLVGCRALPAVPTETPLALSEVPAFDGTAWVELAGGVPAFEEAEKSLEQPGSFSPLDALGRPGPAVALVGPETLPTAEREPIGMIRPAGWHLVKYDFIDGKYLYNRCHLIGYQLTGENANEENLLTGTRALNIQGMLPFENQVADYVRDTGNHVLYRVTPIYRGEELLARGLTLEGWSVEDGGEGVCFHVYAYNAQPGVVIDYATGDSYADIAPAGPGPTPTPTADPEPTPTPTAPADAPAPAYVINESSGKFHLPGCPGVATMSEKNRRDSNGSRDALIAQGYSPCGSCKP